MHAELTIGMGIVVGHNAVETLMRRAGLQGLPNKRRFRTLRQIFLLELAHRWHGTGFMSHSAVVEDVGYVYQPVMEGIGWTLDDGVHIPTTAADPAEAPGRVADMGTIHFGKLQAKFAMSHFRYRPGARPPTRRPSKS